ncbi:MAG: hypothetical protein MJ200_05200 [Mycoplasmoidaceae bacterium]|nr:hypothetical protein [Mycoplasmoidaceae bacterium]
MYEIVCLDRTKFYQIICAKPGSNVKKLTAFDAYFGLLTKQKDKKM